MFYTNKAIPTSSYNYTFSKTMIEWYISLIKAEYKKDYISPKNYENYLIIISDLFPILNKNEKDELLDIAYWLSKSIKYKIESEFDYINKTSMFSGLGFSAFAVYLFNKNTGLLSNFKDSLNKTLLDESFKKIQNINYNRTSYLDYDAIYGISGTLNYLIKFNWSDKDKFKIECLIKYLAQLVDSYDFEPDSIRFCIKDSKLDIYPNGYIDFGIAHGMIAPLITLSKIDNKYISNNNKKAYYKCLSSLFNIYTTYSIKKENYLLWPSRMSIKDFNNKNLSDLNINHFNFASWCYGSCSIANGLRQSYFYKKNFDLCEKYKNILINLLKVDFDKYNLNTPILCHGYASVLSIITSTYINTKNMDCLYNLDTTLNHIFKSFDRSYRYGFRVPENNIYEKIDDDSLLEGTSGIILSLISLFNANAGYKELLLFQ